MKIAIMGSGGLGAFYGGMLARAGNEVCFIARGEHLAALQSGGLHVESESLGDFHLPRMQAGDDPAALAATFGTVDMVLMGVKAYDLEAATQSILPFLAPETFVLPMLNGVDAADRIGAVVGTERVLGGVVYLSSNLIAPGCIRHVRDAPLLFGEVAGGRSSRCDRLVSAMKDAGIQVEQSEAIVRELWHKYVVASPLAAVSSVTRLATRQVGAQPDARTLFEGASREVEAVARASGVDVASDCVDRALNTIDTVGMQHTVSTLLDLRAGKRLELEAMVGTAVRLGKKLNVPTPISRVLYLALKPYENGAPEGATP